MPEQLLPYNATQLEKNIEQVLANKYLDVDALVIKKLSDPDNCPVEFLPWLAFAESVDVWNDGWPEDTKRAVIANAKLAHQHKGTDGGLQDALNALGVNVRITPWYKMQPEGDVGTADITLFFASSFNTTGSTLFDSAILDNVKQTIDSHKRLSMHYTLNVGIELFQTMAVNHSLQIGVVIDMNMETLAA